MILQVALVPLLTSSPKTSHLLLFAMHVGCSSVGPPTTAPSLHHGTVYKYETFVVFVIFLLCGFFSIYAILFLCLLPFATQFGCVSGASSTTAPDLSTGRSVVEYELDYSVPVHMRTAGRHAAGMKPSCRNFSARTQRARRSCRWRTLSLNGSLNEATRGCKARSCRCKARSRSLNARIRVRL